MEKNSIVTTILTVTIAIICVATILVPTLSDATKTEETFTNEGLFNYGIFEPTDTYTLEYDATDGSIEVGGVAVTPITGISTTSYGSVSVISSDNVLLRYGSNQSGYYLQIIGIDSNNATVLAGGLTVTATISNSALSVTYAGSDNVSTTKTFTFTEMYAIVPTEDEAILKASTSEVYIKGDSPLYASGLTTVTAWNNMFHFEGTYDDGITITSPSLPGATYDNIKWNIEPVSGYIDLYKLTSVEFDIINNGTTVHATYSYFAVPTEVTAELSQHMTDAQNNIIMVIPVLMICAILITAVGMLYFRNKD